MQCGFWHLSWIFFSELLWPAGYAWTDKFIVLFGVLFGLNDIVKGIANFFVIFMQGYLCENVGIETIFVVLLAMELACKFWFIL